jgi:dTDP-4-amino-4,6-dideoxygalactose transaminase
MEMLPDFIARKKEIIAFYKNQLQNVGDIHFQQVYDHVNPNWWMPTISTQKQREVLQKLNDNKLQSRPFWIPMNQLPMFRDNIFYQQHNHSESLYRQCLSIPCSTNISAESLETVAAVIKSCF